MKLKAITIFLIIVLALIPVYRLYKYLEQKMNPKESIRHFITWMITIFILIFVFTFFVVFIIKMLFPGA